MPNKSFPASQIARWLSSCEDVRVPQIYAVFLSKQICSQGSPSDIPCRDTGNSARDIRGTAVVRDDNCVQATHLDYGDRFRFAKVLIRVLIRLGQQISQFANAQVFGVSGLKRRTQDAFCYRGDAW